MNVLYANGTTNARQAWLFVCQKGYKSVYVLKEGLNYWAETIMNPQKPVSTSPDDEFANYDFRKAAGGVLGCGTLVPEEGQSAVSTPAMPGLPLGSKKKRTSGGCS